jgi:hypothetical protein
MTERDHERGVRWQRPPEFADDLDVAALYARLLAEDEVTLEHEYRMGRDGFASRSDNLWLAEHSEAIARRAAEDGLRVRASDPETGFEHRRWRRNLRHESLRVFLDGPLTAEIADPAAKLTREATAIVRELEKHGHTFFNFHYERHALLTADMTLFLFREIERQAEAAGLKLRWDRRDDIGMNLAVVNRRRRRTRRARAATEQ